MPRYDDGICMGRPIIVSIADAEDGLTIILSPVQLAGAMTGDDVGYGTTAGRLWGLATLIGGGLELAGAAGLMLAPEPTMVTKVGGWALALHGSDTASTGLRQMVTGRSESTLTAQGSAAVARAFGTDPATAAMLGTMIDIVVPLGVGAGIGAARVAAVRGGRINLLIEEAAGGHTIARHVGRTEAQLRARLATQTRIPAASTFFTQGQAEIAISRAIRSNAGAIRAWATAPGSKLPHVVVADCGEVVGHGIVRATGTLVAMRRVRIVLKSTTIEGRPYFVLTSFPVP